MGGAQEPQHGVAAACQVVASLVSIGANEYPLVSCLVTALLRGTQQVEEKDWHLALRHLPGKLLASLLMELKSFETREKQCQGVRSVSDALMCVVSKPTGAPLVSHLPKLLLAEGGLF